MAYSIEGFSGAINIKWQNISADENKTMTIGGLNVAGRYETESGGTDETAPYPTAAEVESFVEKASDFENLLRAFTTNSNGAMDMPMIRFEVGGES